MNKKGIEKMSFEENFGIVNAFLVAMAYQAKGDWAKILGMVKGKKYITPQEIEEGLDYIEKKGFGTPITFGSEDYPETLMKVTCPPFVVLAKGNRNLLYADEAQRNETLAVVISDKTPKSLIDYARTAMEEDLALVAVSTKDTMRTKFEKEVERYCKAGKGLLLTEGVNKSKERQEDIAKAVDIIDQLGYDYPDEEMLSEKISDLGLFIRYRTADRLTYHDKDEKKEME